MFVCCECCVLSDRGLCEGLITRPEESYQLWRVVVCDQETSKTRRLKPATGLWKIQSQWVVTPRKQTNNNKATSLQIVVLWVVKLSSLMRRDTFGKVDPKERGNMFHNVSNKIKLS
jgi:hypothetical protein